MQAVIFDIDGTLLQSSDEDDSLYRQAIERVVGPVRFRPDLSDYKHVSDSGILVQLLDDNDIEADPDLISAIKDQFLVATETHVRKFGPFQEIPGAKRLLARLQDSERYAVAIATGGWSHTALYKLNTAGFELNGVSMKSSDDAIERVEIMRLALEALGDGFELITYYGDAPWDELACQQLGWSFRAVGARMRGIESYDQEFVAR